jgi:microcystin degradation protein MlrC
MISIAEAQNTFGKLLAPVYKRVCELGESPQVLSAAVLMTQSWLDVPNLGWSTLVVTDAAPDLARRSAEELADMCWKRRREMTVEFHSAEESIALALACEGRPVVIADGADATNSGAGGDSTHLLRQMVGRRIPGGALTIMVDPAAVAHARAAGEGRPFQFAVGGKRDHIFSKPLAVSGEVLSLKPARYVLSGHGGNNLSVDMGMSATVRVGDVTLLLVEAPGPGSTPAMYRCVGLEPKDFKVVIVKSPAGFRAEYEPFAVEIILSDCPGCASPHYAGLPYRRISRPLWPLDDIADRRDVDWVKGEGRCE